VAAVQDLHSGPPERVPAASEEPRCGPEKVAAALAPGRSATGFQAAAAPVAPLRARPGYSGSADPSAAELEGLESMPFAGLPPTRKQPARVNLKKALNLLARFVRKDLANENSRAAHFV